MTRSTPRSAFCFHLFRKTRLHPRFVSQTNSPSNFRQHVSAERNPRVGSPAGRQRRKRDAVDCTAAQEVAVPLLANEMGNIVTGADQGRDCGAAEIQRLTENAPRWPDVNT